MGRSTASCFKIIACGGDSTDNDGVGASEGKGSSDKRGWSFRKRSASHRVLSNTVISEIPSSSTKESPETASIKLQTQPDITSPEKTPAITWTEEMPQSLTSVNSTVSDTRDATEDMTVQDVNPDESVIIVMQTAIRKFLAQGEMLKLRKVVKLQAAVRGHLVRRHAVGTLRCVQAIVKMQTLVRARRARISSEGSCAAKNNHGSIISVKNDLVPKQNAMSTSIEKLLSNKFAHQLMESTPRTKQIYIKCDPSRSDSAWKWLERWMSVSSMETGQPQKPEPRMEQEVYDKVASSVCQSETEFPSESSEPTDLKDEIAETVVISKSEEDLITYDANNFEACQPNSPSESDNLELHQSENLDSLNPGAQPEQSDLISQMEVESNLGKPEMQSEQSSCSVKKFVPGQVETEEKKFVLGTRKATNPAFVAAQSKFEELSSTAKSARSTSSFNQDVAVESNSDTISSARDKANGTSENSILNTSRDKFGGSECGTELSISSTLDSPDRPDIAGIDVDQEVTNETDSTKNVVIEASGETNTTKSDLSGSIMVQSEKFDQGNGAMSESANTVPTVDSSQEMQKSETNAPDVQMKQVRKTCHQTYKSSPDASPRSHMTVPESQGTPSSQVSLRAERTKSDKGSSKQKRKSWSVGKKSPSNPDHDSGLRSSLEQLPKDQNKSGKRRNSFGSAKPDFVDQEPRDSNSSNSLPSYMQATESARAKALANSSPRSSPDMQNKEIYIKKRHSLPGANGRHGSPHIQRSTSQAQQGSKGNDHPHERKWQR